MKSVRRVARAISVVMVAVIAALAVTVICASEEDRIELTQIVENLNNEEEPGRQIDWDSLPQEVIAWVEVPGTNIDEPIVQATPDVPNAYLHKDALGQGAYGTPYIDCECSVDSRFVMVYGHHMSDGSVFADFARFSNEDYAREHNRIGLYERDGETVELWVCAVDIVNASCERLVVDQEVDFKKLIADADLAFGNLSEDGQLFAFTTCSYQTRNSRTTVYAWC